ncbi:hypothetical protein H5410_018661 [Solanum commersonii]|uniref:Uncharacterized protein n=1 Tax=Solanum commersonii TaxID=4109 RepID=A0A9J6A2N8_SOLCO|nr:hypothetical protein H5410_018661 [Solanum commersonii]
MRNQGRLSCRILDELGAKNQHYDMTYKFWTCSDELRGLDVHPPWSVQLSVEANDNYKEEDKN